MKFLNSLNPNLLLALGIAAVIAVMTVFWLWSQEPKYRVLFSNFSDKDGGAIVAALEQMMALDLTQQEEFIALNSRLVLLKQISRDFELDLNDNGKKTDQENFERLQSIDETYRRRFQGFLKRLLRRP